MGQYRKILLIVDPAMQPSPALTRAVGLARKTGAVLHLCLVDYSATLAGLRYVDPGFMKTMADLYMQSRLKWLRQQRDSLARDGITAEHSAVWGRPAEQMILGKVLELHPDILIKDVQAASPAVRLIHTPLDWQLLRLCPVPVMLVNPRASTVPKRIIATVDPMEGERGPAELNNRVLQTALELALQCDAELHALYAFAYVPLPGDDVVGLSIASYPQLNSRLRDAHQKAFDRLMDKHSVPADRRHFVEGISPETVITTFACEYQSDLVVMGTVFRVGVDRLIFGSTAERTLSGLDCDVLTLKPEGFMGNLQHWFNATVNPGISYTQDAA